MRATRNWSPGACRSCEGQPICRSGDTAPCSFVTPRTTSSRSMRNTDPGADPALDWGAGWASVPDDGGLQHELDRELAPKHPLAAARPLVFGRCTACDDVVVRLLDPADGPELAVVHLTWSGRAEKPTADGVAWPYFERLTVDSFVARFLRGGEHV